MPCSAHSKEASQRDDFITPRTSLVDAVFRVFLANQNTPLTPIELGERIGRPPMTILRTLAGANCVQGHPSGCRRTRDPRILRLDTFSTTFYNDRSTPL